MRPSLRMRPATVRGYAPSARTFREDPAERGTLDDPVLGPVVHRPTGPWTPAVHDLLAFVAAAGLDGVPTVHGFDADGREVLSFLDGEALDPGVREPTDEMIADAAAWLRRFHDVVRGWTPGPRAWRQTAADLAPGEIVCHNDPGTYNWVIRDGRFAGRDRLGSGRTRTSDRRPRVPVLDGRAALRPRAGGRRRAPRADRGRGVRRRSSPSEVLDAVAPRLMRSVDRIEAGIERGDPGMLSLQARGEPENTRRAVEAMLARLPEHPRRALTDASGVRSPP